MMSSACWVRCPIPFYDYEFESKHFRKEGVDPGQHHFYVLPIEFLPFSHGTLRFGYPHGCATALLSAH